MYLDPHHEYKLGKQRMKELIDDAERRRIAKSLDRDAMEKTPLDPVKKPIEKELAPFTILDRSEDTGHTVTYPHTGCVSPHETYRPLATHEEVSEDCSNCERSSHIMEIL